MEPEAVGAWGTETTGDRVEDLEHPRFLMEQRKPVDNPAPETGDVGFKRPFEKTGDVGFKRPFEMS